MHKKMKQILTCCRVVKKSCEKVCRVVWSTRARALRQRTDCPDNQLLDWDLIIMTVLIIILTRMMMCMWMNDNHGYNHEDDNEHDNCDENVEK